MPLSPVPSPLMSMPRSVTLSLAPAFTMMPLVPGTTNPAVTPSQAIVIAFVIVTAPKPPGSRQLISPPAAVFEIAPAKVLHGAVRLHGLASLPTPETQVRVCACAGAAPAPSDTTAATAASESNMRRSPAAAFPLDIRVITSPFMGWPAPLSRRLGWGNQMEKERSDAHSRIGDRPGQEQLQRRRIGCIRPGRSAPAPAP